MVVSPGALPAYSPLPSIFSIHSGRFCTPLLVIPGMSCRARKKGSQQPSRKHPWTL